MDSFDNPKIVGGFFGGVGLLLVFALLIIPSFAGKDTQFFVTNTVNATSIALGDLTDVTLINTLNNQILVYNSTSNLWENENQTTISTSNATCSNLGSGKILCASYSGNNLAFKSLLAGSAITLSNDTNTIIITNAGVWHDIAGTGISVNQTSGNVLITNTLPESTVCSNSTSSAGHMGLCKNNTISLRTLLAGSGISLSLNSTDITITNNGVTSLSANSPLSASASSGSVTLSCPTCAITNANDILLDSSSPSDGSTSWTSGSFTAKKYLTIALYIKGNSTIVTNGYVGIRFNGDSGNNYDYVSLERGSRSHSEGQSSGRIAMIDENFDYYSTMQIYNSATTPKQIKEDTMASITTATIGGQEFQGWIVWQNTANQITSITLLRVTGTWTFDSSSTLLVYGHD